MDFLIELAIEVVLELFAQRSIKVSKRMPTIVRSAFVLLIALFFLAAIVLLIWIGTNALRKDTLAGVFIIFLALFLLIMSGVRLRRMYVKKIQKQDDISNERNGGRPHCDKEETMKHFSIDAFAQFDKKWALVCAGTVERHNAMTISWGGLGTLWSRPVATVYVKPIRYTYRFLEENEYFTVSFYPEECRKSLAAMGALSGRNCDKDAAAGLTPVPAGESVTYAQAEATLLCRKIYWQDLDIERIPTDAVKTYYETEAPHRMYIGEVIDVIGAEK